MGQAASLGDGGGPGSAAMPPGFGPGRKSRPNWLGWVLAAFIMVSCFWFVDFDELIAALRQLTLLEVVGLVLISSAERLTRALNWACLLSMVAVRTPVARVVRFFYQGSFSGVFLPSHVGGDLLRAWWVMRDSGSSHPVLASVIVERLIGFASAVNWAVLGGGVFLSYLHPEAKLMWIGLGLLGLAAVNITFAALMSRRLHGTVLNLLGRFRHGRLTGLIHKFYEAFTRFSRDPRRLASNALLACVAQGLQMALYLGIALSLDATISIGPFFAAAALHGLILKLPIAPDGWGIGELAAIGVYGLIGIDPAKAFAISAIGHLVPMVALSPGFVFLLFGDRSERLPHVGVDPA